MPIANENPDLDVAAMRAAFLEDAGDLWDKQADKFLALLATSEDKSVKLTFAATIDASESEASLEVDLGFGQRFKDKRTRTFGDPKQRTLFESQGDGAPLPEEGGPVEAYKGRNGKRKKKDEAELTE